MNLTITPAKIRLWNVREYHSLMEKGVLNPEERNESINLLSFPDIYLSISELLPPKKLK
jgi:hypothetical protein